MKRFGAAMLALLAMCVSSFHVPIISAFFNIDKYFPSAIRFSNTNKGELFNEIRKCFGTIGSYAHGSSLNSVTIREMDRIDTQNNRVGTGTLQQNWLLAYDFETFAKEHCSLCYCGRQGRPE